MLMLNFLHFLKASKDNLVKFWLRLPGFTCYYFTILNSLIRGNINATASFYFEFYVFVTSNFSFIYQSRRHQNLNPVTNGKKIFITIKKGFNDVYYPLIIP